MLNKKGFGNSGQVWVETVIYTLIGLTVIGILLAVATPKINSIKDKMLIEQSIQVLDQINDKIYEVQRAPGNRRVVDLKISKGKFVIDAANDKLYLVVESNYKYSEPDTPVSLGKINVLTTVASPWLVKIEAEYSVDITFNSDSSIETKEFEKAPSPYTLYIENLGQGTDGRIAVDIRE